MSRMREKLSRGSCIIDGCDRKYVSRGLCDRHRQAFYRGLRAQDGQEAKIEFEQDAIRDGLILAEGEQADFTTNNPFLKPRSEAAQ